MTETQTFTSVRDLLEVTSASAARLRSELMTTVHDAIDHWDQTPVNPAACLDAARSMTATRAYFALQPR